MERLFRYCVRSGLHRQVLTRHLSTNHNPQQGFFARVLQNIKKEFEENKDIKDGLEKFRKETQKLEETEALKRAREKYKKVEAESIRDVNEVFQSARDSIKEAEIIKKTFDKAKGAAQEISKQSELFKETTAFKKISEASKSVEREINDSEMLSSLYRAPSELLKRAERSGGNLSNRQFEPNENVQSIELHKDSRWSQNWKKFKEENPYVNKVFEFKMKLDESDNPLVRVTKNLVDKIGDTVGGLFQTTDLSNVMNEICKVDPDFDINVFIKDCEKFIIPTILESMCQNRPDILSDWCHEAVFNVLSQPQQEAKKLGLTIKSRILDIQNIELALGKMMEQGPVLVLTFQAQQLTYVVDSKGNVVEGDSEKVVQNTYVMAFCRDQTDLNPMTAWRLIDVAMQQSQFMF